MLKLNNVKIKLILKLKTVGLYCESGGFFNLKKHF